MFRNALLGGCLFGILLLPAQGAEGDLLFADEMNDAKESLNKYAMYLNAGKPVVDRRVVKIADYCLSLTNNRLYTLKRDFTDFELSLEMRMVSDEVKDGKHRGFAGVILRTGYIRPEDKGHEEEERNFRFFCQVGRKMALHDIETKGKSPRRTASQRNLIQSKMPVFEQGKWYSLQIRAVGQNVSLAVDGVELGTIPASSPKDRFNERGGIALWSHAGEAQFRNLIVRELAAPDKKDKK
ncbi:MAG: DUF1080 domain-containing protein [Victivallaceae bacterium]|nr:DUF1080 domain-containing protein [Victivallaceae bacterium]